MSEEIMYNDCSLHTLFVPRVPFLKLEFSIKFKQKEKHGMSIPTLFKNSFVVRSWSVLIKRNNS